jgi:hypothetical protein
MESKSEISHPENIKNFEIIVSFCEKLGAKYNPPVEKLKVLVMKDRLNEVRLMHNDYIASRAKKELAINGKKAVYDRIKTVAKGAKNLFDITKASETSKADVRSYVQLITGSNVRSKKKKDGTIDEKSISNSHLGFSEVLDNFVELVFYLKASEDYTPNETYLKTASLDALIPKANAAFTDVAEKSVTANQLMIRRDFGLYGEITGLVDISLSCKKYVRALCGNRSQEAKALSAIKLKRIKRMKGTDGQ